MYNFISNPVLLNENQYISDFITEYDYLNWQRGHKILIKASTGTGKSKFIIKYLSDMCYRLNSRALFLTNRNALQAQLKAQNPDAVRFVDFMNYQKLSSLVRYNKCNIHNQYAIIVSDESHYFFADATFASHTDRALHYLLDNCNNSIRIFLSATTDILESYLQNYSKRCEFVYSYMRPAKFDKYYYWYKDKTIKTFLQQLPANEKAIFFTQNIKVAYELHQEFSNSSFVCAENHRYYGKYCDTNTMKELRDFERFSSQILFATSVIDNGINIKDPDLKHIIIDLFDYDSIIQCMGRRRNAFDKFGNLILPNLYIKQFRQPSVHTRMNDNKRKLVIVDDLRTMPINDFCNQYGTKYTHGLVYTLAPFGTVEYYVNAAKEHKLQYDLQLMEYMNHIDCQLGHLNLFCIVSHMDFRLFRNKADEIIALSLADKLKKYLGKPLYGNEKKAFLDFIKKDVLRPLEGGYKVTTINAYFEDLKIPYRIETRKQNSKNLDNYGKRYWILVDVTTPQLHGN